MRKKFGTGRFWAAEQIKNVFKSFQNLYLVFTLKQMHVTLAFDCFDVYVMVLNSKFTKNELVNQMNDSCALRAGWWS